MIFSTNVFVNNSRFGLSSTGFKKAFLKPVLDRPNLELLTNTLVEKIITSNKKAVGVKIKNKKGTQIIGSTCEIVLCGGSINSPQLLMLSGIGPDSREH